MSQANVQNGKTPASTATRARARKPKAAEAEAALSPDMPVVEPPPDLAPLPAPASAAVETLEVETETPPLEMPSVTLSEMARAETESAESEPESDLSPPTALKLKVEQQILLRAVERAGAAVSRKSAPVLRNLLVRAAQDSQTLTVTGYNQRICLACQVDAEVEQSGEFLISSECLANLVGRLPDAKLRLDSSAGDGWLTLSCTGIGYKERIQNTDNYPELPVLESNVASNQQYTLTAAELSRGLRAVMFAVSKDEDKITHAVLLEVWRGEGGEDGFSLITADGGNAALYTVTDKHHDLHNPARQFLLPVQAVPAIEKMAFMAGTFQCVCDQAGKMLGFRAEVSQSDDSTSRISAIIRLREGKFPNVRAALPDPGSASATATLDYASLTTALSRQEALRAKRLLLEVVFDQVVLKTIGAEAGREVTETLDADTKRSGKIHLALTPLLAAFKGIECEQVGVRLDSQLPQQHIIDQDQEYDHRVVVNYIDTPLQVMSMRLLGTGEAKRDARTSGARSADKAKGSSSKGSRR